jgi:hypothetical protein
MLRPINLRIIPYVVAQIAQQTALRAAFLVDQAIQEKQVSPHAVVTS